ncbi:SDR family NAD(P)-dependent oxidoreductase [Luteibacter pinisoli]|uniref:SDR family NAD(P)-dependent oxidoreductase n=1 Tax=Luteibacter pinisoli TaxID=2589080 RepID=A0A4Y5Z2T2_9GAMM|nr:SDR family NAD(P)-dependent oxidoreductase [Luteibacter pinisoli]QDE39652.1 SDR family NAD(P)-dependent oxidoreductase [Luteibacter pinisoli]
MRTSGNTIFITGGGSGIGRGLAEALHRQGNQVIIGGRRRERLEGVLAANPGMAAVEIDVSNPADIERVAARLIADYPALNVLINNAGIMELDHAAGRQDDAQMVSTITTNLMGPLRLTSALVDHLKTQPGATIIYNSSVLAFVPLAFTAVYSATKAALHSYVLSQRFLLADEGVRVLEIAPPWVRTELMNSQEAELAMPVDDFIAQTMAVLNSGADEVLVEGALPMRNNAGPAEHAFVNAFNTQVTPIFGGG